MNIKHFNIFIYLLSVYFSLITAKSYSQYTIYSKSENGDCPGAILIDSVVAGPVSAPEGYGKTMEIKGGKNNKFAFEKEHNTVWYKIISPCDAVFTFSLVPESVNDDYDFMIFRGEQDLCNKIQNKTIQPLRTCISRNDKNIESKTGLKEGATDEFIPTGPGPSFSKPLNVIKGEVLYLIVDNVYKNGKGHTLYLNYKEKASPPATIKDTIIVNNKYDLNIILTDKETGELINGDITINPYNRQDGQEPLHFKNTSAIFIPVYVKHKYNIEVISQGYMIINLDTIIPEHQKISTIKIGLEKIKEGKSISFTNILFYGNEARFLEESYPALHNLANFMDINPEVKIEIQGHVNSPKNWGNYNSKEFDMNLSVLRAKAVYDYLVKENINPKRLSYQGFGATRMLYPYASSEEEQKQNRRVEILILKK